MPTVVNLRDSYKEQGSELPRRSKDAVKVALAAESQTGFQTLGFYGPLSLHWTGQHAGLSAQVWGRFRDESDPDPQNHAWVGEHRICDAQGQYLNIALDVGANGGSYVLDTGAAVDQVEIRVVNGSDVLTPITDDLFIAKLS